MSLFLFFIFGLILLLSGSRGVIVNSLLISKYSKISPFIVGATIVAIGTSLPEIVVSFFGGVQKAADLSLGNIIGSNIANIGLILGLSLLLHPLYIGKNKTQENMVVCLALSLLLFFLFFIDGISFNYGLYFIIFGFVVVLWEILNGKKTGLTEEINIKSKRTPFSSVGLLVFSLLSLFIGGKFLVDSGVQIANMLKVPQEIIGITAIAIGTSLPELAVSVSGLIKGATKAEEKLVIGNILGSNIFNILFGAGILGLFGVKHFSDTLSLFVFLIFTIIFCAIIFSYRGKYIPRFFGIILILFYLSYLLLLIFMGNI